MSVKVVGLDIAKNVFQVHGADSIATTGRGKQSNSYVPNRSIKQVLGYPLTKQFRELLGEAG